MVDQFDKTVLVEINDDETLGLETKDYFNEARSDKSGATDDADFLVINLLHKLNPVRLDVRNEHPNGSQGDRVGDESV